MLSSLLLAAAVGYILGALPFGYVVARAKGVNIFEVGSKNPGATNVMRIGGKKPALITLAGDMAKGVPLVLLAQHLQLRPDLISAIGLAAFMGHLYPIFFKFEGGKGVATALGVLLALYWPLGLGVIGVWLAVFAAFRISSLSSITAFAVAPVVAWYVVPNYMLGIVGMSILLIARHKSNIKALLKGEERKFGKKEES